MNKQDFLQECSSSYLDVLAALGYFREVVQSQCEVVAKKHIAALAGVVGVEVKDLKWSQYANPDKPASTGNGIASLGWKAKRQEDLYLWFYVNWNREAAEGEGPLSVAFDIWLKDKGKAKSLAAVLDDLCEVSPFADQSWLYNSDGSSLLFYINLEENEFSLFGEKLDQLLAFVIPFLKSFEGIQESFLP